MRPTIALLHAATTLTLALGVATPAHAQAPRPAAPAGAPEAGLLLGMGDGRTLWLELGDSARVAWQAPHLVVPRRDGWWFVASGERCGLDIDNAHGGGGIGFDYAFVLRYQALAIARAGTTAEVVIDTDNALMECDVAATKIDSVRAWKYKVALDSAKGDSSKVERMPAPGAPDEPGMDCVDSRETVTFIGATAISVEERYSQTEHCAPGGYTTSGTNSVARFGTDSGIALRPLLSPALRRRAERNRGGDEESCAFDDSPERLDDSWVVRRAPGRWVADIWLDAPNVCRGGEEHELSLPLPRSFTGERPLPVAWDAFAKRHPGVTDASPSPSGTWVLMQWNDSITVHRVRDGRVGERVARADSVGYASVVMMRWATAAEAARWRRELPALAPPTVRVVASMPPRDQE